MLGGARDVVSNPSDYFDGIGTCRRLVEQQSVPVDVIRDIAESRIWVGFCAWSRQALVAARVRYSVFRGR